jgi:hypothetical protein
VGHDGCRLRRDLDVPHRAEHSSAGVGQEHGDMPASILGIEMRLVRRKAVGKMITQEEIGSCLCLEGRDEGDRMRGHTSILS